jgi:hypothetical protein
VRYIAINCSYCNKSFLKDARYVNENKKLGHKSFCSPFCLSKDRYKSKELVCENPSCDRTFVRSPNAISPYNFCSRSCIAKTINPSKPKIRYCANVNCSSTFTGYRKYCSLDCIPYPESKYTKEDVIQEIRNFVEENKRIPLKRERYNLYKPARFYFKTWNNAIEAAGFDPNPVMFAHRHIAKDGHTCDSLTERIIDDWLYKNKISHEVHVLYPGNKGFRCDFKVGDYWIEFFGLKGELRRYDYLKKRKIKLIKNFKLKLIEIQTKDLFPENRLKEKLNLYFKTP